MARAIKKYLVIVGFIFLVNAAPFFLGGALADQDAKNDPSIFFSTDDALFLSEQDVYKYWTEERMVEAIPMPLPEYVTPEDGDNPDLIRMEKAITAEPLVPHLSPAWQPGGGPQPDPSVMYPVSEAFDTMDVSDFQAYGTAPTNPKDGPYAPFQRWTWYQNYLMQATATIGKLFFTDGTKNYSCSASVISRRTIATAAHCIKKGGTGDFYYGFLFCPSYYRAGGSGGPHPSRGCWSWNFAKVSNAWATTAGGAADRDYGCIVTQSTGDTISNNVGNVTGWTGRAANFSSSQPMVSWGYAAAAPFSGYHIIVASSPEWYEVNMTPGDGQVSKYMGNDMTDGCSGGPWWMGVAHNTYEYPDTDGSNATDPWTNGPWINGVNSHKRCRGSCFTPPTSTAGTFWQEEGSPQFRNTTSDDDESEDIFQRCFEWE